MTVENISWSISTKECCRPRRGLNPRPPGLQSDDASNWATEAGYLQMRQHKAWWDFTDPGLRWLHCAKKALVLQKAAYYLSLTLKMPKKTCIWKCHLFMSSAEYSCKFFKLTFAYRQTVWTLIRLLLEEQSDLGPHYFQKWLLKSKADDKADDNCVIGILSVKLTLCMLSKHFSSSHFKVFSYFSHKKRFLFAALWSLTGTWRLKSISIKSMYVVINMGSIW